MPSRIERELIDARRGNLRGIFRFPIERYADQILPHAVAVTTGQEGQLRCPGGQAFSGADYFYSLAVR